jgi:hypothetical protein
MRYSTSATYLTSETYSDADAADFIDPNGDVSNSGFTVVGAADAYDAINDLIRDPTVPGSGEKLTFSVSPGSSGAAVVELDLTTLQVGVVSRIDFYVYLRLASHPLTLGDSTVAYANLRWNGVLQSTGIGKVLTSNATTTPAAGWFTVGWDVAGAQDVLDGARLLLRIGGEVATGEIWSAYGVVTFGMGDVFYVEAAAAYVAGAEAGQVFVAGADEAEVYAAGAEAGAVIP